MRALGILLLLTAWMPIQSVAQTKVLANEVTYTSGNDKMTSLVGCGPLLLNPCYAPTVENPNNALANDNNYARLLASPGLALDLGSYKGVIELKFAQTLPADTWSYVRMEGDSELFKALLGGSLGNLLGDVLGYVLIGNQEVIIDARMGGTTVLSRSSTQGFGTDRVKLIQDGDGNNYLAIRPASDYDRLRITNQTGSLLGLGIEKTLDIYNAFYYEDIGNDCDRPFATSFDGGGGIGLEVGDLNDQNLGNAIDNDENSFSRLKSSSVLNLNVASTLSQYFYFPTTSAETTTANIKLALGSGGLVNTDLLGAIEIIFFEDNTIVSRRSLQSSLLNNTNALTLLDSGEPVTLTFAPGKAFDRIAIKLNSPVGVNLLGNGVKIYDVQRYDDIAGCPNPLIAAIPSATNNPFDNPTCASGLIDFENVDFAQRAVDGNNESYATIYADAGNLLVSGPTEGFIEMDLGNVPANKTTYVRINYDADVCPPTMERVYANSQSWGSIITGGVSNRPNATDGNPKTYSTITTGLGLLGIGTTWQNLFFEETVPAGTPVTIKLGKEYSGLVLAGGLSVVGIGENGLDIGVIQPVDGGLLDLLVADNVVEYTFVPSNLSGAQNYTGIRISQGSLVGVAQNAKVYGAYYEKPGVANCDPIDNETNPDVLDVLHGVKDLGLGVASATASVSNPWNAVDNDLDTYAMMSRGVAVANRAFLNVVFKQQAMPGDELHIVTEVPGNPILSLELIKGYKIQRFLGDQPVGPELDNNSGVLRLKLLGLGYANKYKIIVTPYDEPYDRVKISYGSVVGVLGDFTKIYDVSIVPEIDIPESPTELCLGDNLVLNPTDICTIYDVYTTETGMDKWQVVNEFEFEMPEDLTAGLHTLYVQAIRNGCPIGERQEIKVEINDIPILDDIKIDNQTFAFDTTIEVSPGDVVEVIPTIDWGDSNKQEIVWEMENPETPSEWIAIPFAETEVDGTIKFTIPDFGEVTLPDNTVIDIRSKDIPIRLILESDKGCQTIEEGMLLRIDGKSQLIVNPNITNKLKN